MEMVFYRTMCERWNGTGEVPTKVMLNAQCNLGGMYKYGHGVSQDYERAMEWHRKSASQGNAGAQFNLSAMYWNGHAVLQDIVRAVEWLSKVAIQGHPNAQEVLNSV